MTHRPTVLHLVDDTTAGGVMRVVDFLVSSGRLQAQAEHITQQVARGSIRPACLEADIIVSHLTLNWRGLPGLTALRAANLRTPMIHVEHSYTAGFVAHNVPKPRRFLAMLRLGFAIFNKVVAVSEAQAAWMRDQSLCRADKVTVIASCVDLQAFRAIAQRTGPVRVFGAIGRLDRQKGFDTLIAAFRTLTQPDIALHIYGQGEEEASLRRLASGDPRIHFMGFAATPTDAFDAVDAVIMPSRWEAYGLVAIEALSAGKPLICANVDGLNDHAAHGAIVVPLGNESDIAGALSQAMTKDTGALAHHLSEPALEDAFLQSWTDLIAHQSVPRGHAA
jgi:glycosyltransferase involved in cell wall biosynthesis